MLEESDDEPVTDQQALDLEFIAHSRTDLPVVIAVGDKLRDAAWRFIKDHDSDPFKLLDAINKWDEASK